MINKIEKIRNKIDKIDDKILDLINKRINEIKKVAIFKKKYKIPSYIKEREKDIIKNKIINNKRKNLNNELIKDILKRIMYESYNIENEKIVIKNYKKYKILFIGGRGKIGKIFKNLFYKSKYKIYEINSTDWDKKKSIEILKNINIIFISVPISEFIKILNIINQKIKKKISIIDVSSNKNISVKIMENKYNIPFIAIHPMFNENIYTITKQKIIICNYKYISKFKWFIEQLKLWGINIIEIDYKTHDKYMSYIQTLRYFITMIYMNFIKEKNINFDKLLKLSTPINEILLSTFYSFFKKNINLYTEIIFSNDNNIDVINSFVNYINLNINKFIYKNKYLINKDFINVKENIKDKKDYLYKLNNLIIKNIYIYK